MIHALGTREPSVQRFTDERIALWNETNPITKGVGPEQNSKLSTSGIQSRTRMLIKDFLKIRIGQKL